MQTSSELVLLLSHLLPCPVLDIFPFIMDIFLPPTNTPEAGPRQNEEEDTVGFLSPSPFLQSVPWIYLICDELSDSDKGVSKLKFSLSLEDYRIVEAKQSYNGGISSSGTFTRKRNLHPVQMKVSLSLDYRPMGACYTTLFPL